MMALQGMGPKAPKYAANENFRIAQLSKAGVMAGMGTRWGLGTVRWGLYSCIGCGHSFGALKSGGQALDAQ
eukprot:scaffold9807_cov40-Prasinocladus_malaysianus.AAC.1